MADMSSLLTFFDDSSPRTLVLCFDGTTNQFSDHNTNVVKLYKLLQRNTPRQLCYYQPGIGTGTFTPNGYFSPIMRRLESWLDQAFAIFIDAHIRSGYAFIMQNYRPGDKICLFGFSRGAYIARALAGMLHKVGLLPKDNAEQVRFAYKLYKQTGPQNDHLAEEYKKTFCTEVSIDFIGVWDTVESVGFFAGRNLPFATNNSTIKVFRHALALDECRAKFRPNLWGSQYFSDSSSEASGEEIAARARSEVGGAEVPQQKQIAFGSSEQGQEQNISEDNVEVKNEKKEEKTDALEMWFAGCHSDVGGGFLSSEGQHDLSRISLRWMVREIYLVAEQCGITFDPEGLRSSAISIFDTPQENEMIYLKSGALLGTVKEEDTEGSAIRQLQHERLKAEVQAKYATMREQRAIFNEIVQKLQDEFDAEKLDIRGPLTVQDSRDAGAALHSRLRTWQVWAALFWWFLELWCIGYRYYDAEYNPRKTFTPNLGRGRKIPGNPKIHWTVKERMKQGYIPRATWKKGNEAYEGRAF